MTRTIIRRITIAAATLGCVSLTTLAGAGAPLASIGPHQPPQVQLANTYSAQTYVNRGGGPQEVQLAATYSAQTGVNRGPGPGPLTQA